MRDIKLNLPPGVNPDEGKLIEDLLADDRIR